MIDRFLPALLALLLSGQVMAQEEQLPPGPDRSNRLTTTVRVTAEVLPTVVNISTERIVTQRHRRYGTVDPFSDFFNQFFGARDRHYKTSSLGSGVIIDPAGLILTNDHVVQRASRIIVTMADGQNYEARPVATDEANDVALLQITPLLDRAPLQAIRFGRPGDLLLGEQVITVGNPFGLGHSVASGVLSALGRKAIYDGDVLFNDILQTDAAINPGNSGGPLVNADGELIGINLAIQRDAEGIGFAIPLQRLEEVLSGWLLPARFNQALCGLIPGSEVFSEGRSQAVVDSVREGSPAASAGLQAGDVLVKVDGEPVHQAIQVSLKLWNRQANETVTFTLKDGREVPVTLVPVPQLSGQALARERLEVELQELTPRLAAALKLPYSRGLVVSDLVPQGVLARRGVLKGDVIIQVGDVPVSDFQDLNLAFEDLHAGDVIELVIDRIIDQSGRHFLRRYVVDIPFRL